MADVIVFHHAQGLTPGVHAFADDLRAAGHRVTTPDLYDGATFPTLPAGVAHAQSLGDEVMRRAEQAAADLTPDAVYAGFSLGVMPAQKLAQTRPGARGALLLHGCAPHEHFGPWPPGLRAQLHTMEADDWGDVEEARALVSAVDAAALFTYPGDQHLFTDSSLGAYDETAAHLVRQRVLAFLDGVG